MIARNTWCVTVSSTVIRRTAASDDRPRYQIGCPEDVKQDKAYKERARRHGRTTTSLPLASARPAAIGRQHDPPIKASTEETTNKRPRSVTLGKAGVNDKSCHEREFKGWRTARARQHH